jgi:hypothetical protein
VAELADAPELYGASGSEPQANGGYDCAPAEVAELADALDSKSSGPLARVGSTPTFGIAVDAT